MVMKVLLVAVLLDNRYILNSHIFIMFVASINSMIDVYLVYSFVE